LSTAFRSSGADRVRVGVGDTVVYGAHGVGRIVAREQRRVGGTERDCIVIELASGLRVTLALEDAAERLRAVLDDTELENVRRTLASEPVARIGPWLKRIKESQAKLASGRATDLAELVRDAAGVEQSRNGSRLSDAERRVYLQARELLTRELCSARGLEPDEADAWIDTQIARPTGFGD
jgi:CarD family transcriptional regulator